MLSRTAPWHGPGDSTARGLFTAGSLGTESFSIQTPCLALRAREHFHSTSVARRDSLLNTVKRPNWHRAASVVVLRGCLAGVIAASSMYSNSSPALSAACETQREQKMLGAAS